MTATAIAIAAAVILSAPRRVRWSPALGGAAGPQPGLSAATSLGAGTAKRLSVAVRARRGAADAVTAEDQQIRCAHLVIVGLSAGLTIHQALQLCVEYGPPASRGGIRRVLRSAQIEGIDAACAQAPPHLDRLFRAIAGAERSGMPLLQLVSSTAEELRQARVGAALARARRLPAQLAGPIALGVLPGFILIVMGPTILTIVDRMLAGPH
jgi:Flp pilus assembly protein TadB